MGLVIFLQLRDTGINEDHQNENKQRLFMQNSPSEIRNHLPSLVFAVDSKADRGEGKLYSGK